MYKIFMIKLYIFSKNIINNFSEDIYNKNFFCVLENCNIKMLFL